MKVKNILGERFKERAFDIESQNLMTRGGYMKQVGNGIYSLFTPAKRIQNKIEAILREEMDAIDGQEVLFPVVMPATLWQSSGRYDSIGSELLRFKDRSGADMVLGMTHEEAAVQMAMNVAGTYQKYPFMIYQIQTKFRDEPRARGGLIRVREFTMKDAYSFHTSQEDLDRYYERAYRAYERIYARAGVPEVIAVKSDSGMMGGKVSHEYMLLTDIGEDTIVTCPECGFRANMEACDNIIENVSDPELMPLEEVFTGDAKTIDEVASLLGITNDKTCKAIVYQRNEDDSYVLVFCRGDLELNETKLTNYLKSKIHPAVDIENANLAAGNIGPVGLDTKATVLYDRSLVGCTNLVCGANKAEYHIKGFTPSRDLPGNTQFVDLTKAVAGGICPKCGKRSLSISRGIEVGNIFQLGTRYTEAMGMTYDTENGERKNPIMGCYGIGVGRLIASVCEAHHDDYGPLWPITIAPWQVEICALRANDENVKAAADKLYKELEDAGVEVLYDDRSVSAGFMFSDADLLGAPIRVVISPKAIARGCFELNARDKSFGGDVAIADAKEAVIAKIRELTEAVNAKVPERM
ncbi:MAG: proline--tRNA ligase [Clostridia bacterium]|nr:proline--tRNA ligase [Clostridia bacterium]